MRASAFSFMVQVSQEVIRELDHGRDRGTKAPPASNPFSFGLGLTAAFAAGSGFPMVPKPGRPGMGGGPKSFLAPVTHVAVIGKTVTENTRAMPPVMMLEDD
jgi:hypothetical protein